MVDSEHPTGHALELAGSATLAGVEVPTRRVTVVQDADTSVLAHRVEMALVVRTLGGPRWPADDEQRPSSKGQQR